MAKAATKANADQGALDGLGACHLGFVGMAGTVSERPELDDRVVLKVTAICCTEPAEERLATGATRVKAKMRVESVEVIEGPTAPDAGPDLFNQDDQGGE